MGAENKSFENANYVRNMGMKGEWKGRMTIDVQRRTDRCNTLLPAAFFRLFLMQLHFSNVKKHLRTQFGRNTKKDLIGVRDFSLQFRVEHLPKTLQFVGEN